MKPFIQKLPLSKNSLFIVENCNAPYFTMSWHQNSEHELILFTQGSGLAFIGKYVGKFEAGDIYFLGKNLPHLFQRYSHEKICAIKIKFRDNCLGYHFLNLPECLDIKELLEISNYGLILNGNSNYRLQSLIKELEFASGINRIILLLQCLQIIAKENEYIILSNKKKHQANYNEIESLDKVFEFTLASFNEPISLSRIASIACMSIPSFCHYFKRRTQKTYVNFLNEVRISNACHQLLESNKPVTAICYECGYNTIGHFHRQFLKLKKITPLQYRKSFLNPIKTFDNLTEKKM